MRRTRGSIPGAIGSVREHDAAVVGRRSASSSRPSPYSSRARARAAAMSGGSRAQEADADAGGDVRARRPERNPPRIARLPGTMPTEISGGALSRGTVSGDAGAEGVPTRGPARRPRAT